MRQLVEALCSDACAGRAPGTPGGEEARRLVEEAFAVAGLRPSLQPVPGAGGANVLAPLTGGGDRWVLVAAHYDHLGRDGEVVYRGADDNAAGVAILIEVARALAASPPNGRNVLFAAFDAEEPPHFVTASMGSEHYARHPTVPLEKIDLMVCMDLVGHALGPAGLPDGVRQTLFALGAERSAGTAAIVDRLARAEPGVVVRRADAETIPPLSDYWAFWSRKIPFLFLSCGRARFYHSPADTPAVLDWAKMEATARWLERLVREVCARPPADAEFRDARDDASTLRSVAELSDLLAPLVPEARRASSKAEALLAACGPDGRLPEARRADLAALVSGIEEGLA